MKKKFKYLCLMSIMLLAISHASAQDKKESDKYVDALSLTMIGQHPSVKSDYHRIDTVNYQHFTPYVKRLYTNSAGLAILFKTTSNQVSANWTVAPYGVGGNNTAINYSGLDLYIRKDGKWLYAGSGAPQGYAGNRTIVSDMEDGEKECMLYLPTYNEIRELKIGVSPDASIEKLDNPFQKRIVVYGSSITQGASASRSGLAYLARLSRAMNIEFVNLGISGSGKMEPEVADMVATMHADAIILDCAANPSPEEITERTNNMVKTIRKQNPTTPIVMIQSVVREGSTFNTKVRERVANQNKNFEAEYTKLKSEGVKDLYIIHSKNFLGDDHEGTIDGTHPNDVGFDRMVKVIQPELSKILKKYWK